jgi:uncharacterized protein (TIGR03000 family)
VYHPAVVVDYGHTAASGGGREQQLEKKVRELEEKLRKMEGKPSKEEVNTARVTVRLPEDARLYVDGVSCPLTSATRSFSTPPLEPGKKYQYTLKAELLRDGETYADSKRITVQAGKESTVDFGDLVPVQAVRR